MFLPLLVPDATPEATVRGFVEAFNAHDPAGVARRVVGGKPFGIGYAPGTPKWTIVVGETKVDGDEATVEVDSDLPDPNRPHTHETVRLRRADGDWRIVPATAFADPKAIQPISILAMMSTNPALWARAKTAAKRTVDLSNVKQVALAVLMYAADHKDRLPLAKGFRAAILPYLRNVEVLTAPGAPKGTVSYFLDPRLSGMLMTSIARPADTAMILEGTPARTAFPWSGRTPVGYVDGHAKTVDAQRVLTARTIPLR